MIVYDLKCPSGHGFEQWFASSADFEMKVAEHALSCPECGDRQIEKGLSAPRINGSASAPAVGPCGEVACGAGSCAMMP